MGKSRLKYGPQVPDVLRKELAGVCKACFSTNPAHRHAHVVAQYRKQFVNELNPEAPAFPRTLGELSGEFCKAFAGTSTNTHQLTAVHLQRLRPEVDPGRT